MSDFILVGSICFTPADVRTARRLRRYLRWSLERIARYLGGVDAWHVRKMLEVTS